MITLRIFMRLPVRKSPFSWEACVGSRIRRSCSERSWAKVDVKEEILCQAVVASISEGGCKKNFK